MKQKVWVLLIFSLVFAYAKGQDKIITTQRDTIYCRILSISLTHILYEQKDDNQNTVGKFISIEQVEEYIPSAPLQGTPLGTFISKPSHEPFSRWQIGVQGGGAYLLSFSTMENNMRYMGIPLSKVDDYSKQLRNGMYFGADAHFFVTPFLGVGLKYALFMTSARLDYTLTTMAGYSETGTDYFGGYAIPTYYSISEKNNIYVNYIGPSVVFQSWLDKNRKFRMNGGLSIGQARYREEGRFDPPLYINTPRGIVFQGNVLTDGNTLGGGIQLSLEYYPSPLLSVGANAGAFLATFKTLKISDKNTSLTQDLNADNRLDMSYIDYSVSVRFHF